MRALLPKEKPDSVSVLDVKAWPNGPRANTYIVLTMVKRSPETQTGVLVVAQSSGPNGLEHPKSLGALDLGGISPNKISIDVGPYQIRKNEYAFGIRSVADGLVGNKGGLAFEFLELFRYQPSGMKSILAELVWGYSRYLEADSRSCNTETTIVSEPSKTSEFYDLTRKHQRSYLGDGRMYPRAAEETPTESCQWFYKLQFPNLHTWDERSGTYTDPENIRGFEVGKPEPWTRDRQ